MKQSVCPWVTLKTDSQLSRFVFLLYGNSGTGKTVLASQFPNPLILACNPGEFGGIFSATPFSPKMIRIDNYEQSLKTLNDIKHSAGSEYKTLVIDSISSLNKLGMKDILEKTGRDIANFEEWNLSAERTRKFIDSVIAFPCNIVFTAFESLIQDEETGRVYGTPGLIGKVGNELQQSCDIVLRLFTSSCDGGRIDYKFQSSPNETWPAKDCTNSLPVEGVIEYGKGFDSFKKLFESISQNI